MRAAHLSTWRQPTAWHTNISTHTHTLTHTHTHTHTHTIADTHKQPHRRVVSSTGSSPQSASYQGNERSETDQSATPGQRAAARGGARRPALTPFPSFETISYFRKTCLSISSDISQMISERPTLLACAAQSAGVPRRAAAGGTAAQLFPRSEAQAASAYPSMWAAERLSVAPPSVHFLFVTASPRCQRHAFKCLDQFSMHSASEFFLWLSSFPRPSPLIR